MNIENHNTINERSREVIKKLRLQNFGNNSRGVVSQKLTELIGSGKIIPKSTYQGYEETRNAPIDVRIAIAQLYKVPLWLVMGLKEDPDKLIYREVQTTC